MGKKIPEFPPETPSQDVWTDYGEKRGIPGEGSKKYVIYCMAHAGNDGGYGFVYFTDDGDECVNFSDNPKDASTFDNPRAAHWAAESELNPGGGLHDAQLIFIMELAGGFSQNLAFIPLDD
jgi:hypothetical protein